MANMQGAPSTQEEQKTALEQYGINLTEIARSGKLDPVIGRLPGWIGQLHGCNQTAPQPLLLPTG